MTLGFGMLRLSARDFWELTPSELAAASRAVLGPRAVLEPMRRTDLNALLELFPD